MAYHNSVLLDEAVDALAIRPGGTYVDATFGGGGHSRAILERLESGKLIAFDQDEAATENLPDDERILFLNHNFRYIKNLLRFHGHIPVDGILADLGVSSHQIDEASRGFSTRYDGPLDMRMNKDAPLSASDVVNTYEADRLAGIFYHYGELKQARKIASVIEKQREQGSFQRTGEFADAIKHLAPRGREHKFMAQVFQALRIEVNKELDALKTFLEQSYEVLSSGGRLVVISYHSLEDRLVKNYMKTGNFGGQLKKDFYGHPLTPWEPVGKVIKPDSSEIAENKRARSARLRVAVKKQDYES